MKMFQFKFDKKKPEMKNLTFSKAREGGGEEEADLHFKIVLSIIIGKHMKMILFKFNRYPTITKNYFLKGVGWQEGNPQS